MRAPIGAGRLDKFDDMSMGRRDHVPARRGRQRDQSVAYNSRCCLTFPCLMAGRPSVWCQSTMTAQQRYHIELTRFALQTTGGSSLRQRGARDRIGDGR